MRVFIAIDISQAAKKEVGKLLKVWQKKHWPVKWVEPEKLHLTLAFLGKMDKDKLQLIKLACQKAAQDISPFKVSFKGLGCFPSYGWPRVIWLGLKGDLKSLARLQKKVKENLTKAGLKFKPRPFSPHITLARVKKMPLKQRREIGRQLKKTRILDLKSKSLIKKVIIYQSRCSSKGSVYQKLAQISLINK